MTPFERMMKKVVVGKTIDDCCLFEGARDQNGHGNVRYKRYGKWTCRKAHQVAYEHYHGVLPEKPLVVRHTCDVRNCVNERHLIPGSSKDNFDDMRERERCQRNERGHFVVPEYEPCPF